MEKMSFRMTKNRRGITLIEVLSAIAVASIGVFGVLVLVPLASRLSQVGFSNEASRSNSTNVLAKAKSYGALDYTRWVQYDSVAGFDVQPFPVSTMGSNAAPMGAVCIDPMLLSKPVGATVNVFPATFANGGEFASATGDTVLMGRVTIAKPGTVTARMGSAVANQFVSEANVVRLNEPVGDLAPPTQKFLDEPGTGRLKREISSSKSSVVLMLPTHDTSMATVNDPTSLMYRAMAVTINGRQFLGTTPDRVFDVIDQLSGSSTIRTDYGMLDLTFGEVDFDSTVNGDNLPSAGWVVMVPYHLDSGTRVAHWNLARGYEIVSSEPATADFRTLNVTLVGPPLNAHNLMVNIGGTPTLTQLQMQAIYIPEAVDIHEMEVRLGAE